MLIWACPSGPIGKVETQAMGPHGTLFSYDLGPKGLFNAANLFTVMRLPLTGVAIALFESGREALGLTLLFVAAMTDFFDGQVARRTGCQSQFGEVFDPTVDKIGFAIVGIWAITRVEDNWLMVAAILFVEFFIALYSANALKKGVQIKVQKSGKWGIAWRGLAVFLFVVASTLSGQLADVIEWVAVGSFFAGILLVGFTLRSYREQLERATT